ncbi:MAG: YncE family protein [Thermoplasmata archaeon]
MGWVIRARARSCRGTILSVGILFILIVVLVPASGSAGPRAATPTVVPGGRASAGIARTGAAAGSAHIETGLGPSLNSGPTSTRTLVLLNSTLVDGNFAAANGLNPLAGTVDTATGAVLIADFGSDSLSRINAATNLNAGTVGAGTLPMAVAYDAGHEEVYVANNGSDNVSVLRGVTYAANTSVGAGNEPDALAYDPSVGDVYVANNASNNVTVINDTRNVVVKNVAVGLEPDAVAYDNATGDIYVANYGSDTVSVINDTLNQVIATVNVGTNPAAEAYDYGTHEVYVANQGSRNVSVVSGSSPYPVLTTVTVASNPSGVAYDPGHGEVFVSNRGPRDVYVIDDTGNTIATIVAVDSHPSGVTYDPSVGEVFVESSGSDKITVVNDTTDLTVASVGIGATPRGIALDPPLAELFVPDEFSNSVEVINDTSNVIVANISVGYHPYSAAFDPAQMEVFVANSASNSVSVIDVNTNQVAYTLGAGYFPVAVTYDSGQNEVYVANSMSNNTTVIDASNNEVVANVTTGGGPDALAYDPGAGEIFVANELTNNTSVINDTVHEVVATIAVGTDPDAVTYDPAQREVFVANLASKNVTIIDAPTNTTVTSVTTNTHPVALAYDAWAGEMLVTTLSHASVSAINTTTDRIVTSVPVGQRPESVLRDPLNSLVYVGNYAQGTLSVISTNYFVTFTESGLPAGTHWSVTLGGVKNSSTTPTIGFWAPNGTWSWSIGALPGYSTAYSGSVTVAGANASEPVVFTVVTYPVTFTEVGLPAGTEWWLNTTGQSAIETTSATIQFNEANGTYYYSTATPNKGYSTNVSDFVVNGAPVAETVTFTLYRYPVTFTESGLPSGTEWWVNVTDGVSFNSTGDSLTFPLTNGTYFYALASANRSWSGAGGDFTVNGAAVSQPAAFSLVTYAVTFTESDLPTGTPWWVNQTGQSPLGSTGTTITTAEPNGSYSYGIGSGNSSFSSPGAVYTVQGRAAAVSVPFALVTYAVTFDASGLPTGTVWTVTLDGTTRSSATGSNVIAEANGTYPYLVASPGYLPTPASGVVGVHGSSETESVSFAVFTYVVTFAETGLPAGTDWSVSTGGQTVNSSSPDHTFLLANGTYPFAVGAVPGEVGTPTHGNVTVSGAAATQAVAFSSSNLSPASTFPWDWIVVGIILLVVLGVAVGVIVRSRPKPVPPPSPPETGSRS